MSDSQVSFATLGNAIGFITKLSGSVTVQSIDGQERVVKIGDPIFFGETVLTGPNGSATIAFIDDTEIVIGNDAVVEITDEVYNSGDNADLVADSSTDIDALQEAILAGDDPTLIQDAPAAGEAQGFEQQRVDVDIDRNDNSALPTFGNDTSSVLPTYGYDTDNGSGSQTGQNQYSVPSSSDRTSDTTTADTTTASTPAVAGIVTVNSITSDDMINAAEAASTITVSGSAIGGDISQGDQVVLVINGTTYTTVVSATGAWSIGVAGSDLAADTEFDVVVTSSNDSGDTVQSVGNSTHTVDQSALFVNIDIDPITEDSMINAAEGNSTVTITGTVTGDAFNSGVVTLVINGVAYETQVGSDGIWSVDVLGSDLTADSDRIVEASVVVSNNIGQEGATDTTESYLVKTGSRASISVNSITSDDVINAEESEGSITVSGRVGFDASAGDVVSMTINGTLYTAVVLANKTWSVEVLGSDLAQDTSFQASVTGQDSAGNPYSATTTSTHTVDTEATAGTVTVNAITSDDVINATEAAGTVSVTGTATGGDISEGDVVTMTINGEEYETTVGADGTWSVNVAGADLAADTEFEVVVTSSDAAGNTVDTTGSSTHTVDTEATAGTVTVNAITSDDVINATEAAGTVSVTGTATGGDISEGDVVTMTINGEEYETTVGADGTWSVNVAGADLAADTEFEVVVTSSDAAGNTVDTTGSSTHTVDLAANANIDIDRITSDSVINSGESADGVMVSITGWVGGDAKPGDTVTITLDGEVIGSATVSNEQNASGKYIYSVDVLGSDLANTTLANPFVTATVTGTDEAGNPFSANSTEIFKVDTFADVDVFLAENNNDGVVNFDEAGNLTVGGWLEAGGNVTSITVTDSEGQMVTLTGNIVVSEDGSGWAYFETNIDVSTLADGELSVVVNVTDIYGNEGVSSPQSIVKDTVADAGTVTVNAITSDDVINVEESGQTITVSGKAVGGDISVGDVVKTTINGKEYSTTVAVGGLWTLAVAGSDLAADTEFEVVVTSSDAVGNTVESKTTSTHVVDTTAPDSLVISLNTDSGSSANDNLTNDGSYTITGIESGATLEYFVDGEWSTTAPTTTEGANTLTVRQVDAAGNASESSTLEFTLDTVAEVAGETVSMNEDSAEPIVIDVLANDESGSVLVPGSVSFDSEKGSVTVNEDGTLLFTPAADFSGVVEITYQVKDEAGNTATATTTVNVTPVTDVPTVELTLEPTTTTTLYSVDLSNVLDGIEDPVGNPAGFTVTAYNSENDVVAISIKDSGTPTGFGVTGQAGNGADSEIGKQEKLVVELDKPASSATFELAWLNSHNETAVYTVKYSDGTSATFTIDGNSDEGGYDRIGAPVTVSVPEGKSILAIEFSTPTTGDRVTTSDYLLHSVSYESAATNYTVDITAAPTDTDHSENITELTVTTPEGTSLSGAEKLGTENGVTTWKISLNSGGFTNNVAIDPETGVVTVKGLILSVPDDFDGELSVTATATAVDPGAAAVSGSATWENSAPELTFADGSDSVVISEEGLVDSDSDVTNGASATGTFNISDAEGQSLALSLVAPTEAMKSGGITLVWITDSSGDLLAKADETEIVRVALTDTDGQHGYVVTLSGPVDHQAIANETVVDINFGIAVNDGAKTTTEFVSVAIEDSAPVAVNDEDSIVVRRETFEVSDIEANWVSYQSGTNVKTFDGTSTLGGLDNDDGKDQIRWGTPASSGLQSGYGFIDNDAGLSGQFELNEDIVIGTFTHYNYPVYDNAITAASMEVSFSVTDDTGVTQPVTLKVDFDHNETPNSNDALASRDIVTVKNTFVTFEWEGEVYTLQVVGFKDINDPDGPVVTSIYTNEDAATSYELVVRVVEGSGYSLPETTGNVLDGEDGVGADALGQDGDVSVVSVAVGVLVTESDASVGASIQGQYGNLVLNADGSYTYQVTASVDKIPAGAQETFSYMIQDSDGSTSSATLSIDVGTNTAPVAQDDGASDALFAGLVGEYYGTNSQLNNISDFRALIESKEPDATFEASNINYQKGDGDVARGTNLQTFLGEDASTLSNDPSDNTDGGIHLQGYVYLAAGTYNFKVTADDGYQITINGEAVATVDGIQSENTTTHQSFTVTESGYQAIDMIWWDQGGAYVFQPVLSADGGQSYFTLDSSILSSGTTEGIVTEAGQSVVIDSDDLLVNDKDVDGDSLTISSIDNVQNGYAYLNADGNIVFTPKAGYTGSASFDYTVTDGKDGYDTATVTLGVKEATGNASVSVSITEVQSNSNWEGFGSKSGVIDSATYHVEDYDEWHQFDNRDDQIVIDEDVEEWLDAREGNNAIYVGEDVDKDGGIQTGSGNDDIFVGNNADGTIQTGGGNDRVQISNDLGDDTKAHIHLGDGDNQLIIGGDVNKHSTVHSGSGDDSVSIGANVEHHADIQLGSGNDTLTIGGEIEKHVSINLGSGNDMLVVSGTVSDKAWVDGGSGSDSVWFESYTRSDYDADKDGIKSNFANFENFKFSDGSIIGNSSAFDSTGSGSAAYFDVQVSVENLSDSETIYSVDIFGVPEGAKLQQAGQDIQINENGSYTVQVADGATSIDDLKVVNESGRDLEEFELTASINTDGINDDLIGTTDESVVVSGSGDDFLSGTTGEDSLLGNSGDDVLFGGNDQVSDTLTGGAGNDIFILNDTADVSNIDIITDFNAAEDALDLTDLLTGIEGSPGKDADADVITKFLTDNVKVTDGHVKVGGEDVAEFGSDSSFDSNLDGSVSSTDSIKVIYNNEEYNINIDG